MRARLLFPRNSLVGRLIWLAAGWSLIVLVAMGVALTAFFHDAAVSRIDRTLAGLIDSLYSGSTVDPGGEVVAPPLTDEQALRVYSGRYWQIADFHGGRLHPVSRSRSLFDADLSAPPKVMAEARARPGRPVFYDSTGPAQNGKEPTRAALQIVFLPGHPGPVAIFVAENRASLEQDARRFAWRIAVSLVILGAGLVAAVVLQVRVGLRPLFSMGREVAEVRTGRAQRIGRDYPAELAPLAGELNALLDHNQETVERQRTHVGNLAHALKTPLAVMLSEADRHPGPLAEVVRRQAAAMQGQVERHLRRARAAARSQASGERTPVDEVMEELARMLGSVFRTRDLDWDSAPGLCFRGERQDLQEMVGNLMENACKYGRSAVIARAEPVARGRLSIVVEDDGDGLPEDRYGEVLKRGARLDEQAPGSGLGLSIADELARAYGGTLALGRSKALGGLRVELTLPAAD